VGHDTSAKRILFVDDEASIRLTLPPVLQQAGFDVHVAESVGDAIFEINSHQFDALISDLNIGEEGDGFLVTSAMRHIQPNCVTFILTGYPAFETALQAIHSQVDDYLVKPVEVESLVTAVKERLMHRLNKLQFPAKRLSNLLRDNTPAIVDASLRSMKGNGESSKSGPKELADYFTIFVNSLAEQLDRESAEVNNDALRAAADYGTAKAHKKGESMARIVREFGHLQTAVYDVVQRNLTNTDTVTTLIADLKTLSRGLSILMELSLESFGKVAFSRSRK
jgi:ActR/RegA family two-component response regulator